MTRRVEVRGADDAAIADLARVNGGHLPVFHGHLAGLPGAVFFQAGKQLQHGMARGLGAGVAFVCSLALGAGRGGLAAAVAGFAHGVSSWA